MKLNEITALPHHLRLTIPDAYLDIFQHMNVQYYLTIFNDSVFDMLNQLGIDGDYINRHQVGFYAVDQRLSYRAEVKAGETIATYTRLLARSSKSLHFMVFMVNETQNQLAATMEALAFHVDRTVKKSAPFLPDLVVELDARLAEDNALKWTVPLSKAIHVGI